MYDPGGAEVWASGAAYDPRWAIGAGWSPGSFFAGSLYPQEGSG